MRYHFFLHYGCFFQNLGKEGRRTFMHTTVDYKQNDALLLQEERPNSSLSAHERLFGSNSSRENSSVSNLKCVP